MQNQQSYTSNQETQPLVSFIITYYNLPVQMLQLRVSHQRSDEV